MNSFQQLEARLRAAKDERDGVVAESSSSSPSASTLREGQALLSEPTEPLPEQCCGNECSNCVWITYFDKLQAWQAQQKQAKKQQQEQQRQQQQPQAQEHQ
jgi:hypothetical protein